MAFKRVPVNNHNKYINHCNFFGHELINYIPIISRKKQISNYVGSSFFLKKI